MTKFLFALIIGVLAGVIDVLPMIFQKLDKYSNGSAFIHWIIVTFVIFYIQFGVNGWLKGLIIATLMSLPVIILIMKTDAKSAVPILVMSAILGSAVGFISDKLVK